MQGTQMGTQVDRIRVYLQHQGIVVTQFRLKWRLIWRKPITPQKDIAQFTRQLAHLLYGGFPLIEGLNVLIQQYSPRSLMPDLLLRIKSFLEEGMSMSQALQHYPDYFSPFYCSMIDVSEQCGQLPEQLLHLAEYQDKLLTLKQKIQRAFYYPLILLSITGIVFLLMMLFVVPQFERLFIEANAHLPGLTRGLIQCTRNLHIYLPIIGILSLGMSLLGVYFQKTRRLIMEAGKQRLLKMPWIGDLLRKIALLRFSHTLMITLSAGLPMTEALLASAEVVQYSLYKEAILKARQLVMEGVALDQALASTGYFPRMMLQIINTGQITGRLHKNLAQLVDYFEGQLNESLSTLSNLIEPLLLLFMGCLIGGLMLALYWPIFELGTVMGSI